MMDEAAVREVLTNLDRLAAVHALESGLLASSPMLAGDRIKYVMLEASAFAFGEAAGLLRAAIDSGPSGYRGDDGR